MPDITKRRPGTMRLIDALTSGYRYPLAAIVSILHRISGGIMFVLLPFIIWMFDASVTSEVSFAQFDAVFANGIGWLGGWFFKLIALVLIWAYLHHFIAGLRHVWMDMTHSVSLRFGQQSSIVTLAASGVLTLALLGKLFGWY